MIVCSLDFTSIYHCLNYYRLIFCQFDSHCRGVGAGTMWAIPCIHTLCKVEGQTMFQHPLPSLVFGKNKKKLKFLAFKQIHIYIQCILSSQTKVQGYSWKMAFSCFKLVSHFSRTLIKLDPPHTHCPFHSYAQTPVARPCTPQNVM